jgi:hypothetical protein
MFVPVLLLVLGVVLSTVPLEREASRQDKKDNNHG